jgi:hypothetical protein
LLELSAIARITASVEPPAGHGHINLMGLLGKLTWADASPDRLRPVTAAALVFTVCRKWRRFF